jgi:PAS domain S-box-containing protein
VVNDAPEAAGLRLAFLEAIVDIADDAVFGLDADGRVAGFNRSAERVFGYSGTELAGKDSLTLFPQHLRPGVRAVLETVAAGDRVSRFETEIQRRDGMLSPISLSACPVLDADGKPVASAVIARDITEQVLTQAALAEIEASARESEALAHVGGWLWDVRTGAVQWTDELHRIHGVDPRDFGGTFDAHMATVNPDDRLRVQAALEDCVASGHGFDAEYRVTRPGGETRWVYARAAPTVGSAGTVVGLRGVVHDVTDRQSAGDGR